MFYFCTQYPQFRYYSLMSGTRKSILNNIKILKNSMNSLLSGHVCIDYTPNCTNKYYTIVYTTIHVSGILPQSTQAQLMRGEFPETLCIEQGVVLSCRFAESKVRWTSRVLRRMVIVSQSCVKSGRREIHVALSSADETKEGQLQCTCTCRESRDIDY